MLGLEKTGSNYRNERPETARILGSAVTMATDLCRLLLPLHPRRAALQHNTTKRKDFTEEEKRRGETFTSFPGEDGALKLVYKLGLSWL